MQKVEGSSPFSRLQKARKCGPLSFFRGAIPKCLSKPAPNRHRSTWVVELRRVRANGRSGVIGRVDRRTGTVLLGVGGSATRACAGMRAPRALAGDVPVIRGGQA